jgi:hypothetical protein
MIKAPTLFVIFLICLCVTLLDESLLAQELSPLPQPDVKPLISETYVNDKDGNRIDDNLFEKTKKALADMRLAVTPEEQRQAQARVDEMVNVELIFKEQITKEQIDIFLTLGGEITYIYKAVSYGWNGRIPIGKVETLTSIMGPDLVLIDEPGVVLRH